jgi:integrase
VFGEVHGGRVVATPRHGPTARRGKLKPDQSADQRALSENEGRPHYTGLRFNRASALQWSDIDFEAGVIHTRRSQVRHVVAEVSDIKRAPEDVPMLPEVADASMGGPMGGKAATLTRSTDPRDSRNPRRTRTSK